ncbi:MAG: DEAD/DEAH box helicase [Cytophagales bacterium CG18_big_fil_WC_8_21_14_2_50_42_9]|nr:MAG: DEAD/DEAH box helicase [Cytophagales bacterium CG18_big_fil_WC_8_21_14_2_50_42_9]
MNFTAYHAKYFAHQLTRRLPANDIGKLTASLQDAQVDLNPHQVDAALFAFNSPLSKGAILADEVGLGKTIEAGIILSQKWAERKRKLLIIAPANLRKQWSQELADKFFLPSIILESKSFNDIIKDGNLSPFDQKGIVICSYQFARAKDIYIKHIDWDLVIIDEAHRLRNVYKSSNKIGKAIKYALDGKLKVLLTATPLQNSLLELYGLVSIIDDHIFGDLKSFKSQFSRLVDDENFDDLKTRLQPVCKRTLRRDVLEYINYTNRIAIVESFYPYKDEQQLYNLVSDYLSQTETRSYALPASQRQLMTLILRKLLASSSYAISGTLQALANKLNILLNDQQEDNTENLIAENFEEYEELKEEWSEEEEETDTEINRLTPEEIAQIIAEKEQLEKFAQLASSIQKNSKGDILFTALEKGFEKLQAMGAPKKALIFTESTRTQDYLRRILEAKGFAGEIVLFNGSNNDAKSKEIYNNWLERHQNTDRVSGSKTADMRAALVDYFKEEATIMIATEAAAEGINLQFCSLIVNYDLPWNPQRIEQRIGRCHRYGQKFDVVVVNFLNQANEADKRVYDLLDQKFRLFNGVFGASDEVLGSIESGIDFEKRIARIYQDYRKPEEIKEAFDNLQKELESQITERLEVTRQQLLDNFDVEVKDKLRISMEKGKEYLGRYEEWLWNITKFFLQNVAKFNHSDDSFYLNQNPFSGEKIHPGPYRLLKAGGNQKKSEIAVAIDTNIYRVGHPLAQRIIEACKNQFLPEKELLFNYTDTPDKITVLEDFIGKSGWMQVNCLTITSFDQEDYLLIAGATNDGNILDADLCHKFFSVFATETANQVLPKPQEVSTLILQELKSQKAIVLQENEERNNTFFDEEYGKLDKWADDMKNSLEMELKELDKEIKFRKTEAKKLLNLAQKIKEQRVIKELEKSRNEKRMSLYQTQDAIENQKDELLNDIESRLKQKIDESELFTFKWKLI